MSTDQQYLEQLPAIDMAAFADVQFMREPRLRLLQQAYHDLQRMKQRWAEIGVFGAAGAQMINPRLHTIEASANATMPRATLHAWQAEQIELALSAARVLQERVAEYGMKVRAHRMPGAPQWCDLNGERLGSRLYVVKEGVWLFQPYEARRDAPCSWGDVILMSPFRGGGQEVAVTCTVMHSTTELSYHRALETAQLGRWGLRQPPYRPAA